MGFADVRGNVWRYEPGAQGRRHRHTIQEETFVVLAGVVTMYLDEPPVRVDVPTGGVVRVSPGTAPQTVNHGEQEAGVWACGHPPEDGRAEPPESAVGLGRPVYDPADGDLLRSLPGLQGLARRRARGARASARRRASGAGGRRRRRRREHLL